ncbi:MAG TPA: coiled coil domain-containing protein [Terriglobia bacterium]|nr:coiled coil domain-containing protein [Terriglobia bacterium]
MNDKQSYRQRWEAEMKQLNKEIAELVNKLETGIDKEVEALRPKLKAARKKLDELEQKSSEAWGDVKPGLEKAWAELQKSFSDAAARFKRRDQKND